MMAAARCVGTGKHVILLEKNRECGKKVLITGKGRCNITNTSPWREFQTHLHPDKGFIKSAFHHFSNSDIVDFLESIGLPCKVERGNRVFPVSDKSHDVRDALVRYIADGGIKIATGCEVRTVNSVSDGYQLDVDASNGDRVTLTASRVIVATGGLSYPTTGSTGDGYVWAEELGHKLRPLFPSLTAIVPKGYKDDTLKESDKSIKGHIDRTTPLTEIGKELCGNQLKNVGLTLYIDGNTSQDEFGDLDFTDGGLEGPIGFKISRKCVNALVNGSKVSVRIDLKPAVDIEDLTVRINTLWNEVSKDRKTANKQYKERFRVLLTKLLPMSLIPGFVRLNPNVDHKTLAKALKNWKMEISGFVGYERCVITAGGISQEEVSPKTLESKLIPGLYFAGEVLDLDADTGGYNLQIAFSTGYLAGISAAKSL
jgi:predicted flavoprotein YhiN